MLGGPRFRCDRGGVFSGADLLARAVMLKYIDRFTLLLLAVIVVAVVAPIDGTPAAVVQWINEIAIAGLFFSHGAALSPESVRRGAGQWRLQVAILAMTFIVFPCVVLPVSWLAPVLLPAALGTGFLYLGALPSAVTSSIAFTAIARGNVPAAICGAAASNVFGMMATPFVFMLLAQSGGHAGLDVGHALIQIVIQLLLPFALGQALRPWLAGFMDRHEKAAARYDRGVILLIVYTAFSQFVASGYWRDTPAWALVAAVVICSVLLAVMISLAVGIARALRFSRADEAALLFCGSKKSLASGLPMANVLFAHQPGLGLIILPIMIYNQTQIIVGALIARRYERKAVAEAERAGGVAP